MPEGWSLLAGGLPGASRPKIEGGVVVVETGADEDRPGEDPAAGPATVLKGIQGAVARIEAWSAKTEAHMELLAGTMAVNAMDRRQERRRGRRRLAGAALAVVILVAVGLAAGAVVQSQHPVLTRADPTLGWRDHVWEHYGQAFMDCFARARREESGKAECVLEVRTR